MKGGAALVGLLALGLSTGCTAIGEGEGWVRSDRLLVDECWSGPFDLEPDFFGTVPFRDTQQIRVQRGADLMELSDGVAIQVAGVTDIRENQLGQELQVGLAPKLWEDINPTATPSEEPPVNLALYLQFSCHSQNSVLYATSGTIVFDALFSGDPAETSGADKLTNASFEVTVGNPRDAEPGSTELPPDRVSQLSGSFRFHFVRGQPSQPFP